MIDDPHTTLIILQFQLPIVQNTNQLCKYLKQPKKLPCACLSDQHRHKQR